MADFYDIIGKTVGVIYTFEGEKAPGFKHYHIWQSDIISKWLLAIQDLKCRPLIFDVIPDALTQGYGRYKRPCRHDPRR